jgi:uncharacterized Tic20 family protein
MNLPDSTPESRMWAALSHISALSGFVIPFGNIAGPLIIWLVKRDELSFVDDQAKEALNFNIYMAVAGVLIFVLIGIPIVIVLAITWLVLIVMAAIKANEGTAYRYPITLRLVK